MAKGDITIRQETRPCMVSVLRPRDKRSLGYVEIKALWHKWVTRTELLAVDVPGGRLTDGVIYAQKNMPCEIVYGVVEMEDGSITLIDARYMRFLDSGKMFAEYDWRSDEDKDGSGNIQERNQRDV